jgi:hypothetical protein
LRVFDELHFVTAGLRWYGEAMERTNSGENLSFFGRLRMAVRLIFDAEFARQLTLPSARAPEATDKTETSATKTIAPARLHASGLLLLNSLQREGRLVDFLQQDVATFSDEEIGAAARVVHGGCRKVLRQYFELEPATKESEGSAITIQKGFNAQRIQLTGNVAGEPPFRGTLKHHGWVAKEVRMPTLSEAMDPRVVAPAEVELA